MNTSTNASAPAAPYQPDARGSERVAPDGELERCTKRPRNDISDPNIWTQHFWDRIFQPLTTNTKCNPIIAKAIHPFLNRIKDEIEQAHKDHHKSATLDSFEKLHKKYNFGLDLQREIAVYQYNGYITRQQEQAMQNILKFNFVES